MEAVAREKFACPACGAEAHWNPGKQALVCPFCGTTSPMDAPPDAAGAVKEHDLVTALRELPDEKRGWKSAKVSVRSQSCQAISVFDQGQVAQRCEFCGSAQIVPYEQVKPPIVIPMHYDAARQAELFAAFAKEHYPVRRYTVSQLTLNRAMLPKTTEVFVLAHPHTASFRE